MVIQKIVLLLHWQCKILKNMETKVYKIKKGYYRSCSTIEVELPIVKWYVDNLVDHAKHDDHFNYSTIIHKNDDIVNWVKSKGTNLPNVNIFDLDTFYFVNIGDALFYDEIETVERLMFPEVSILRFDKRTNKFHDVVIPVEFIGGGEMICKLYSYYKDNDYRTGSVRRDILNFTDYDTWDAIFKITLNPKCLQEYKNGILDLIHMGETSIDFDATENLCNKLIDVKTFDRKDLELYVGLVNGNFVLTKIAVNNN